MALYGDLTFDSRVRREAATLASCGIEVTVVCLEGGSRPDLPEPDLPEGVRVIVRRPDTTGILPGTGDVHSTRPRGRVRRMADMAGWLVGYTRNLRSWGRSAIRAAGTVDAWHVHDFPALAAISSGARDIPIVYDSHEIFVEAGTARTLPGPARTLLRGFERRLVRRTAAMITVNDAVARVLDRRYHPRRLVVVHNCPPRRTVGPGPDLLRSAAGIGVSEPVVLYHGGIGPDRGIEQLLAAILEPGLERVHLVIMGDGTDPESYAAMARDPRFGGRAHLLPAVRPAELLAWVRSADVGGVLIQRTTLNHYLSTPNKLFECLAAGVPVVASDFPAMREVVDDPGGPLGRLVDSTDVSAAASAIRSILELPPGDRDALRARCLEAVRTHWSWEVQSRGLVELYRDLLDEPTVGGSGAALDDHHPGSAVDPGDPPRGS